MVILSKDYPAQSISRSSCDPRIPDGYAGGQYAIGGTRRLALAAVAVVFCEADATQLLPTVVRKRLSENFSLSQKHADNWYALYAFGSVYNLCT